jgi:DNA-binding transcriptional LysR family regulator
VRAGFGLAYLIDDMVQADVAEGRLTRVLADWCPPFSGYHLYYPSRRQLAPAFGLLVNALRFKNDSSHRAPRANGGPRAVVPDAKR